MTTAQRIIKYFAIGLAALLVISIVSGVIALVSSLSNAFGGRETPPKELKYIESFDGAAISSLKIELDVTSLTVKEGEFSLKTNNEDISWRVVDQTLTIKEKERVKIFGVDAEYKLELCVPEGTVFENVNIEAGVSEILISELKTDSLKLDLGVGRTEIESLEVTDRAEINGGVGEFIVRSGSVGKLHFDMGVGKADLSFSLGADSEINGGIGSMTVNLSGGKENYRLAVSKALGDISVDGQSVSGYTTLGDGSNSVEINGGVGSIKITFE